ncbi:uncharacterized protein LOC129565623 [Sitodiplosis mosellana]|uniref:uncharacterized protein LOC129565623 n=1 Tax=Sitodiplosis mosellana TaxID=263140 RepID=UPI002443F8A6|nr:uncharacterized protein LOC129565623 [Sitodiplosis mosellana]XP_055296677.1 uncharacterized protein LOC129565623 [Sitodiplosis mosellana]
MFLFDDNFRDLKMAIKIPPEDNGNIQRSFAPIRRDHTASVSSERNSNIFSTVVIVPIVAILVVAIFAWFLGSPTIIVNRGMNGVIVWGNTNIHGNDEESLQKLLKYLEETKKN